MSKIGKIPVELPAGVSSIIEGKSLKITGPKGSLEIILPEEIDVTEKDNKLIFSVSKKSFSSKALFGTYRALAANNVKGVSAGWEKKLEMVGTGYRAEMQGKTLVLAIGFSHPVKMDAPEGINIKVEKSVITIEGVDKELVGQFAADVRSVRPPEPYKGKGIKYVGEYIRRKAGKAAKTAA